MIRSIVPGSGPSAAEFAPTSPFFFVSGTIQEVARLRQWIPGPGTG
jgi:hypothetical protein